MPPTVGGWSNSSARSVATVEPSFGPFGNATARAPPPKQRARRPFDTLVRGANNVDFRAVDPIAWWTVTVIRLRDRKTRDAQSFRAVMESDASLLFLARATPNEPGTDGCDKDHADEFEVDLRVGAVWAERWEGEQPKYYAVPDTGILLPPGGTAIIEVDEEIKIPANRLGIVFPKARLAFRTGVYPLTTKVDPTYTGWLKIFVHNYTNRTHRLQRGQAIASLMLLDTNHAVTDHRMPDLRAQAQSEKRYAGPLLSYAMYTPLGAAAVGSGLGGLLVLLVQQLIGA